MQFKISIHCAQVSTFVIEEHASRDEAVNHWSQKLDDVMECGKLMLIGDVFINPSKITFVVVEELKIETAEPAAGATTIEV